MDGQNRLLLSESRSTRSIDHFPFVKRILATLINALVRAIYGKSIIDLKQEFHRLKCLLKAAERDAHRLASLNQVLRENANIGNKHRDKKISELLEQAHVSPESGLLTPAGTVQYLTWTTLALSRMQPMNDDLSWVIILVTLEGEPEPSQKNHPLRVAIADLLRANFSWSGDVIAQYDNEYVVLLTGADLIRATNRIRKELRAYVGWALGVDSRLNGQQADVAIVIRAGLMLFRSLPPGHRTIELVAEVYKEALLATRQSPEFLRIDIGQP